MHRYVIAREIDYQSAEPQRARRQRQRLHMSDEISVIPEHTRQLVFWTLYYLDRSHSLAFTSPYLINDIHAAVAFDNQSAQARQDDLLEGK